MIQCFFILWQDWVIEIYESGPSPSSPASQINHLRAAPHHREVFPFNFTESSDVVFGDSAFSEGEVEDEKKES